MSIPSAQFMAEVHYDPETGEFSRLKVGRDGKSFVYVYQAHESNNGYARVAACGERYYAHRLAWYYVHGVLPEGELDHVNGDRSDNRIANLRPASRALNAANCVRRGKHLRGVVPYRRKFRAQIKLNNVHYNLGSFDTEQEAHEAFCRASVAARGEFARLD